MISQANISFFRNKRNRREKCILDLEVFQSFNDLYFSRMLHASVRFLSTYFSAFLKKSKFCLTHRRTHDEETEEIFQNNIYEFFHQLIFNDIGEEH